MTAISNQMPPFIIDRKRYYEWIDSGALGPEDHIELLGGQLVPKMPIGKRHTVCVNRLNMHFAKLGAEQVTVAVHNPVQIDDYNEPEPDVALLKPEAQRDLSDHPRPQDVLLVIEVADTSLLRDRNVKLPLYARVGVPEVWIIDLNSNAVFVHREPAEGDYGLIKRHVAADELAAIAFPAHKITVSALLQ
jgi:Uma2 family endonuclease